MNKLMIYIQMVNFRSLYNPIKVAINSVILGVIDMKAFIN